MDFITTTAPPVRVTIDGTTYDLPRFRQRHFKAWVTKRVSDTANAAIAPLKDPEAQARFLMFFQPPPVDTSALMAEVTTPEGAEYVNETCMCEAGVPEAVRQAFHANVDPLVQRDLAERLASNAAARKTQQSESGDPGARGNPQTGQAQESGGLPETTSKTSPTGTGSTPDATPT